MKKKIFISYAREDFRAAKKLSEYLKILGSEPWLDDTSLLPGQKWKQRIKHAIEESDFFIALLSSNSVTKRGFVQKELKQAIDLLEEFPNESVFVIPVRLDECWPKHDKLKELHWADMFPSWEDGLRKITIALGLNSKNQLIFSTETVRPNSIIISASLGFMNIKGEFLFYFYIPEFKKSGHDNKILPKIEDSGLDFDPHLEQQKDIVKFFRRVLPSFFGLKVQKEIELKQKWSTWGKGVYSKWSIEHVIKNINRDDQLFTDFSTRLELQSKTYRGYFMPLNFYRTELIPEDEREYYNVTEAVWNSDRFSEINSWFKNLIKQALSIWNKDFHNREVKVESRFEEAYYEEENEMTSSAIIYTWY